MTSTQIISVITAILAAGLIAVVSFKTDILRTNGPGSPYSFSKFQMLLWTFVICPIFVIHWGFHYGEAGFVYINDDSLILLGISLGTTLTSIVIDQTHIAAQTKGVSTFSGTLKAAGASGSGFWSDLIAGDNNQPSVQRLQNLIFTLVYVVIYISVFFSNNKEYADFDNTAYILMSASSGSYLIGKGMNK